MELEKILIGLFISLIIIIWGNWDFFIYLYMKKKERLINKKDFNKYNFLKELNYIYGGYNDYVNISLKTISNEGKVFLAKKINYGKDNFIILGEIDTGNNEIVFRLFLGHKSAKYILLSNNVDLSDKAKLISDLDASFKIPIFNKVFFKNLHSKVYHKIALSGENTLRPYD